MDCTLGPPPPICRSDCWLQALGSQNTSSSPHPSPTSHHPPTRGVAGCAQDDHSAARCECSSQLLRAQQEPVLSACIDDDGGGPR